MKPKVNVHQAKTQFSRLLRRVAAGEEVTVANRGATVARILPPASERKKYLGVYGDTIKIADDFDAPLPEAVQQTFEPIRKRDSRKK